jgi:hypothetical protein
VRKQNSFDSAVWTGLELTPKSFSKQLISKRVDAALSLTDFSSSICNTIVDVLLCRYRVGVLPHERSNFFRGYPSVGKASQLR